jgi:hypothetical protein
MFIPLMMESVAVAQATPRQGKIELATGNAVSAMLADVSRQPIGREMTVSDLLSRTGSTDAMRATLEEADQIGGPRWIDEQTCQVRLEIPAAKVAHRLVKICDQAGDKSPVKPAELRTAIRGWERRSFSAIGTSAAPAGNEPAAIPTTQRAVVAMPAVPPDWTSQFLRAEGSHGPMISKLRAARAAEQKALVDLRKQVDALQLTPTATVGDAARDPAVNQAIGRAIQRAKLTQLHYLADGGATVQVTVDLADVWRELTSVQP